MTEMKEKRISVSSNKNSIFRFSKYLGMRRNNVDSVLRNDKERKEKNLHFDEEICSRNHHIQHLQVYAKFYNLLRNWIFKV